MNDATGQPYSLYQGSVDGNEILKIEIDLTLVNNETLITLRNNATNATFEFYFAAEEGAEPENLKIQVDAEGEEVIAASEIGFDSNNTILQVKNLDPVAADWEVRLPEEA